MHDHNIINVITISLQPVNITLTCHKPSSSMSTRMAGFTKRKSAPANFANEDGKKV